MIALGGDFYGIPGQPISDGNSPAERVQRFTAAFNSRRAARFTARSAEDPGGDAKEINAVNQAIKEGKQPHEAYDALGDTLSESGTASPAAAALFRPSCRWAAT